MRFAGATTGFPAAEANLRKPNDSRSGKATTELLLRRKVLRVGETGGRSEEELAGLWLLMCFME